MEWWICLIGPCFFSGRRRHTSFDCDWSSDVCSSDLVEERHAEVDGAMDGGNRFGFVRGAVELRHAHAAEAHGEIGRASCRERVEIPVGVVDLRKKRVDGNKRRLRLELQQT